MGSVCPLALDTGEAREELADAMSHHAANGNLAHDDKNRKVPVA
jgi:hypothetical protein